MRTAMISDWNGARRLVRQLLTGCALLLPVAGYAGQAAPTIKLFPTTVLEEIKHTGAVAKEMESGLQAVIERLDQQPMDFYVRQLEEPLWDARSKTAEFVGTTPENLVFVENATYGHRSRR